MSRNNSKARKSYYNKFDRRKVARLLGVKVSSLTFKGNRVTNIGSKEVGLDNGSNTKG